MQPWLSRSFRPTRPLAASTCFPHPHHFPNHPQPRPSRSFRPTRSLADSVGHSGPLGLWLPPPVSFTLTTFITFTIIHSLDSVGHSGPLGPWLIPCLFSFLISLLLHHCLDSVGHSGPLGLWRPLFLFFHSPYFLFHHFPTSSPPPGLSRSFRPTRSLATFILSSTFLLFWFAHPYLLTLRS